tara:strand:- start:137 stop:364 length:228 start_codon:yes stop_codon:yes gene_type:complete
MDSYKNREQVINALLEYYSWGWKNKNTKELKLELQSLYKNGFKGLENWTDEELETEYKRPTLIHAYRKTMGKKNG